jgi:hypothetical protein
MGDSQFSDQAVDRDARTRGNFERHELVEDRFIDIIGQALVSLNCHAAPAQSRLTDSCTRRWTAQVSYRHGRQRHGNRILSGHIVYDTIYDPADEGFCSATEPLAYLADPLWGAFL